MVDVIATFLLFVLTQAPAAGAPGQAAPSADEDAAVMAAVLEAASAQVKSGWVMLAAHTSTFACNPPVDTGFNLQGCGGMRTSGESVEERLGSVRDDIPGLPADLLADIVRRNQESITLTRTLAARVQQVLWAPDLSSEMPKGSPAFAAYFSRPGYGQAGTKALIYIGTVNWTDASQSIGQYVYLEKRGAKWVIGGHSQVWNMSGGVAAAQRTMTYSVEGLRIFADELNQKLPVPVDSNTQLVHAAAGEKRLEFQVRFVNGGGSGQELRSSAVRQNLRSLSCGSEEIRGFLSHGVRLLIRLEASDGRPLTTFEIVPADCGL